MNLFTLSDAQAISGLLHGRLEPNQIDEVSRWLQSVNAKVLWMLASIEVRRAADDMRKAP